MKSSPLKHLANLLLACSILMTSQSVLAEDNIYTWTIRDDGKLQMRYSEWGGNWNPWNLSGGACFGYKGSGNFGLMACDDPGYSWSLNNGKLKLRYFQWGGNWTPWNLSGGACYDYQNSNLGLVACDSAQGNWLLHSNSQLEWNDDNDGGVLVYLGGGIFGLEPNGLVVESVFDEGIPSDSTEAESDDWCGTPKVLEYLVEYCAIETSEKRFDYIKTFINEVEAKALEIESILASSNMVTALTDELYSELEDIKRVATESGLHHSKADDQNAYFHNSKELIGEAMNILKRINEVRNLAKSEIVSN